MKAPVYESMLAEASSDYSDSSDFTDEFYGMSQDIEKMKSKIKNPRWLKWMKVTDQNFGTDCEAPAHQQPARFSRGATLPHAPTAR